MTAAAHRLPRWDMSVVYPGLDSPQFEQGFRTVLQGVADLTALFDTYHVTRRDPTPLDEETVRAFETVLERYNAVWEATWTLGAYIMSFISTDSRNALAQAKLSELLQRTGLQHDTMRLGHLDARFTAWIGSLDIEALIERSDTARAHAFALRKARRQAAHLMAPAEEALATEMDLTGGTAWSRLHNTVTSQLAVELEFGGTVQSLPMSMVRNLAYEADRAVRRRAYEAELAAWQRAAVPLAAALNSIKGEVNALTARRGWPSPLDAALHDNAIDRRTLDAMLEAARAAFPDFRRYLRAKARALGLPALAWYDMYAPVGASDAVWEYDRAASFIIAQFGTYSPKMRDLAARAFDEHWIDAEPRPGKEDGAFCMPLRHGESRILANYKPAFGGVRTLAHELGHAYHNLNLAPCTMLQQLSPMTLAETASIFCETIVRYAALRDAGEQAQLALLDGSLQMACGVVVDIASRFLFEQRVFERRRRHELSIDDFNDLMLQAQHETYGDGLDETALHPYMWAAKSHYYSSQLSFYNFPYMFGFLFGLGLYARYLEDPDTFRTGYDDLLASTGRADAQTLAARFGIDLHAPAFWHGSLDLIRRDIDSFERLTAQSTVPATLVAARHR